MKNKHASTVKHGKSDKAQIGFRQLRYKDGMLLASALVPLLFISACSTEPNSDNSMRVTDRTVTYAERHMQSSKEVEDNIKNSYARLASKRSDVCPKLIQEEQGRPVVERISEVMVNDYCDYFLYPREGQQLSVKVNNQQIEALLIVPTIHNFANGGYQVDSYDKHVIRLSYNGATYKPKNLSYDVAMTISDKAYS